jgi:hypothetical protein
MPSFAKATAGRLANRWTGLCLGYRLLVIYYQEEASLSPAVADLTRPTLVHHSETRL